MPQPPTPTERLERKMQLAGCRLCAFLAWLDERDDKLAKGWRDAIGTPRYSHKAIADLIQEDQAGLEYEGEMVGESTVETHRKRHHA